MLLADAAKLAAKIRVLHRKSYNKVTGRFEQHLDDIAETVFDSYTNVTVAEKRLIAFLAHSGEGADLCQDVAKESQLLD